MECKNLESQIELVAKKFMETIPNKDIFIISHFDTDGITSATILVQALKKLDKRFCLKIVPRLEEETIQHYPYESY